MSEYIRRFPKEPSFSQKGLDGFKYPLINENLEVYLVDVKQGHNTYIISKKCTHIYYVLEGKGFFDINGARHEAKTGALIEVTPKVEYTYSGEMKMLLIMNPPWFKGNEEITKLNPLVK